MLITENQLRKIIKETISNVLTEMGAFSFDDPCDAEYIKAMFSYNEDKLGRIKWKQFLLNQSNENLLAWKECAEKVLDDYKFNPKYREVLKLLDRRGLLRKR